MIPVVPVKGDATEACKFMRKAMALEVRRIVTGHDSQGKAVVATDERLAGTSAAGRAGISRVDVWSTDKMPIDNSDAAAELQRKGFVVRHNYVGSGQGSVCRVVEFAPGGAKFMHRTETLDYAICLKGECDLELDDGRMVPDEGGRHLSAARHDARLGRQGLGARGLRLRPDRRRASREGRKKADDPLPDALTEELAGCSSAGSRWCEPWHSLIRRKASLMELI